MDGEAGLLPHVVSARYDCDEKLKRCHEGTRADVLSKVFTWVGCNEANTGNGIPIDTLLQTARVFWINGPGSAGTGKSTIAYTVAWDLDIQHKLGASFFCSRDHSDRRNPKMIILTVAYQLGQFCSAFKDQISTIIKDDPDIVHAVVSCQVEILLVKPLQVLGSRMPYCVVVIDALDECQDGGATSVILSALASFITELAPLKFLITSRPEAHIVEGFTLARLDADTQRYILHQVEQNVVKADIQVYLQSSLQNIRRLYKLTDTWPFSKDVKILAELSSGLFIFAATAISFIEDQNYRDPQAQLSRLIQMLTNGGGAGSYSHLDQLYLQVLGDAFPSMSTDLSSNFKLVVGSIALLNQPLSRYSLLQLLNLSMDSFHATVHHLQSVVILPENQQDVIRLMHPSFYEFIINPLRCIPRFLVKPELQHTLLAQACLNALKTLKKNICCIQDSLAILSHEELAPLIHQYIPTSLQYACFHWAYHLSRSMLSETLLNLFQDICAQHLLYWVEASGLLGNLRESLASLAITQTLLSVCYFSFIVSITIG